MSGWKLVPLGQTEEMYDALSATGKLWRDMNSGKVWRVQAKAAPSPPEDVLERIARAYDKRLGISWARVDGDRSKYAAFIAHRIEAIRAALAAAEGRKDG